MKEIEYEIEDSITKAEENIEIIHDKIENNEKAPTDDEVVEILK